MSLHGSYLHIYAPLRSSKSVDINDGLGESLQSLLGQIVADNSVDDAVRTLAGKLLGVGCSVPMRRAVGVTFHRNRRHSNDQSLCKLLRRSITFVTCRRASNRH